VAQPADERPVDNTPVTIDELPPTPLRDRNIPASAWDQAPLALLQSGDDLAELNETPTAINYKRRIGPWLLWRAGRATRSHSRYVAILSTDLSQQYFFRLFPDGTGDGIGPSGQRHTRFRSWKEDLRDSGDAGKEDLRDSGDAGKEDLRDSGDAGKEDLRDSGGTT